jgi:hypothetical protein
MQAPLRIVIGWPEELLSLCPIGAHEKKGESRGLRVEREKRKSWGEVG